jgi:hypothetical protein
MRVIGISGLGVALSQEEIIARKLYGAYGAGALVQVKTCASLARLMADKSSTGIWKRVIEILSENGTPLAAGR